MISDSQSAKRDSQCQKKLANHFAKVIRNYPKSDSHLAMRYRLFLALCVCMYVCVCVCVCVCVRARARVCVCVCVHMHMYILHVQA